MYKMHLGAVALAASLSLAFGCDSESDIDGHSPYDELVGDYVDDEGRVNFRSWFPNDARENGFRCNGFRANGFRANGFRANGFRCNGFRANGQALNNLNMQGNRLRGEQGGQTLEGTDLEDVRMDVDIEDESQNITEYEYSMTEIEETAAGLVIQAIKYRPKAGGSWVNSCENGAKAVQLKGDWDMTTAERVTSDPAAITWACLGAAFGDCAVWGYIPGNTHNSADLTQFHDTCVKLKRADYCGVGQHHTENGHNIDVYDAEGIQSPVTVGTWDVEAMWGPSGAICMNFTRKLDYTKDINDNSKIYIGCEIPDCVDVNEDGVIDFADYPTALMADRTVPAWKAN